jgi:hypothetical protein
MTIEYRRQLGTLLAYWPMPISLAPVLNRGQRAGISLRDAIECQVDLAGDWDALLTSVLLLNGLRSNPHAGAGGDCGRSSAISRGIPWNICYMC